MKTKKILVTFLAIVLTFAAMSPPVFPQGKLSTAMGDVVFELVGQASIPGAFPTLAQSQYGYLTYVNEISGEEPIFNPGPQNETTALFTFFNDSVAVRVTNNGPIRIIDRVGTTTIYLDYAANGNFADLNTFKDGLPVQTSELRIQFILDTSTGAFTATFVNTITSSESFQLGSHNYVLGKAEQKFRTTVTGRVNLAGAPAAHLAGYSVGDLK